MKKYPYVGALRVWHIPQIPGKAFYVQVDSVSEAEFVCDILADYDLFQFENRIKPDYSNANGIERFEEDGDGGLDWYSFDPEEDESWEI